MIPLLPATPLYKEGILKEGVLFGLAFYDPKDHQMGIYPCSILKRDGILRLLY